MSPLDGWINKLAERHCEHKQIDISAAKGIAKEWRLGWYVAPRSEGWEIGKMMIASPYQRFRIVQDDGAHLRFEEVEDALAFFRTELGIFGVAMFQS